MWPKHVATTECILMTDKLIIIYIETGNIIGMVVNLEQVTTWTGICIIILAV
jgi:hypothetical protein